MATNYLICHSPEHHTTKRNFFLAKSHTFSYLMRYRIFHNLQFQTKLPITYLKLNPKQVRTIVKCVLLSRDLLGALTATAAGATPAILRHVPLVKTSSVAVTML